MVKTGLTEPERGGEITRDSKGAFKRGDRNSWGEPRPPRYGEKTFVLAPRGEVQGKERSSRGRTFRGPIVHLTWGLSSPKVRKNILPPL